MRKSLYSRSVKLSC